MLRGSSLDFHPEEEEERPDATTVLRNLEEYFVLRNKATDATFRCLPQAWQSFPECTKPGSLFMYVYMS